MKTFLTTTLVLGALVTFGATQSADAACNTCGPRAVEAPCPCPVECPCNTCGTPVVEAPCNSCYRPSCGSCYCNYAHNYYYKGLFAQIVESLS